MATFGLYSPIALARYGIDQEVMNLGVGAERIAMILHGYKDVREMVYPQIYAPWKMSDRELASLLRINLYPVTEEGRALMEKILLTLTEHGDAISPCEFTAFQGSFLGKKIQLDVVEPEKGTKLLGPAAWNEIYVYQGNIVGVPTQKEVDDELSRNALKKGVNTGISYMEGVAAQAAYRTEEMVISGSESMKMRTTIAKAPSDINLMLDKVALRYITSNNREIDIRGPIFCTITSKLLE